MSHSTCLVVAAALIFSVSPAWAAPFSFSTGQPDGRMAAATRVEAGCQTYRFASDLDDPNTFLLFEEWDSDEALARHFQTPHMATFREALPGLLAGPPSLKCYEVASATTM